jgi:hypothetical protein
VAITKIKGVKNNLSRVIDYISNDEKTNKEIYDDLHNELEYIGEDYKTEKKLYVTGINCEAQSAYEEMMMIKKHYKKEKGNIAFHSIQSFAADEVTPDEAHEIGLQLAKEMWGDRFQVVVATHLNTKHIHNHFVINSVSFVDGKKYYDNRKNYAELRRLNDSLCKEHNISSIEEKKTKSGLYYPNYLKNISYNNYYTQAKQDLDYAIAISNNYDEFLKIMNNLNYETILRSGKLSIRNNNYKRNIRIERYFGEDYSISNIKKQILGVYLSEKQTYYRNHYQRDNTLDFLFKMNSKGLALSYLKCLKIMNDYPTYTRKCRLSNSIKEEVARMDSFSKETILLVTNHIETEEDLNKYYLSLGKESVEEKQLCKNILKRKDKVVEGIKEIEREVLIR